MHNVVQSLAVALNSPRSCFHQFRTHYTQSHLIRNRAIAGGTRDAAVDFDTHRIFQRHRAVLCHCTAFLYTSVTNEMLKLRAVR